MAFSNNAISILLNRIYDAATFTRLSISYYTTISLVAYNYDTFSTRRFKLKESPLLSELSKFTGYEEDVISSLSL